MGLREWLNKSRTPGVTPPSSSFPAGAEPVWLPGGVEVQVAGESFHADAIRSAQLGTPRGATLVAELVPEPDNRHDPNAVAVYVQHMLVGHLPATVASRVQHALQTFADPHGGRRVSCPALIAFRDVGPQVVLLLDPGPLGLAPVEFEVVSDFDATLRELLTRLDDPAPPMTGADPQARAALAAAQQAMAEVDAAITLARTDRDAARQLLTVLTIGCRTLDRYEEERAYLFGIPAAFLPSARELGRADLT